MMQKEGTFVVTIIGGQLLQIPANFISLLARSLTAASALLVTCPPSLQLKFPRSTHTVLHLLYPPSRHAIRLLPIQPTRLVTIRKMSPSHTNINDSPFKPRDTHHQSPTCTIVLPSPETLTTSTLPPSETPETKWDETSINWGAATLPKDPGYQHYLNKVKLHVQESQRQRDEDRLRVVQKMRDNETLCWSGVRDAERGMFPVLGQDARVRAGGCGTERGAVVGIGEVLLGLLGMWFLWRVGRKRIRAVWGG